MVVHIYNPSTQEAKAERTQLRKHPGQHEIIKKKKNLTKLLKSSSSLVMLH